MKSTFRDRSTRYIREIPALYRVVGDKTWQRGLTINISESGVLLKAAAHLPFKARVEMTFQLPEAIGKFPAGQLTCIGEVVRHAPSTESIPYPVAARFVQFLDPDSASEPATTRRDTT